MPHEDLVQTGLHDLERLDLGADAYSPSQKRLGMRTVLELNPDAMDG